MKNPQHIFSVDVSDVDSANYGIHNFLFGVVTKRGRGRGTAIKSMKKKMPNHSPLVFIILRHGFGGASPRCITISAQNIGFPHPWKTALFEQKCRCKNMLLRLQYASPKGGTLSGQSKERACTQHMLKVIEHQASV